MSKAPSREQFLRDYVDDGLTWEQMAAKYGYTDGRYLRKVKQRWHIPNRRPSRPSPEALEHYLAEAGPTLEEAAGHFGVTWRTVYAWMHLYGISYSFSNRPGDLLRNKMPSEAQRQIILGTVLGDGYLAPCQDGRESQLRLAQSTKHLPYLRWKAEQLAPFTNPESIVVVPNRGRGSRHDLATVHSIRHPYFTQLRHIFYGTGRKVIPFQLLDGLGTLGLAVWIMDDGSYHQRGKYLRLCTNSFSRLEQAHLCDWFAASWSVEPKLIKDQRGATLLYFSRADTAILVGLIQDHVVPCLLYKLGLAASS